MLFDLRGRGRRRAVPGIYLFLAILMGGGLIFFGIGGNVSGGLFDALSDRSNNSADSGFQKRPDTAKNGAVAQPASAPAQAAYLKVQVEELAGPKYSDPNTGALTDDGKQKFPAVETTWDKYVKLNPDPVDLTVATRMAFLYESLATWAKAAGAWDAYLST